VVEGGGVLPFGSVVADASQRNFFFVTSGAGTGTVQPTFSAQVFAKALSAVAGETASANASSSVSEFLCTGAVGLCSSTALVRTFQPTELQAAVSAVPRLATSRSVRWSSRLRQQSLHFAAQLNGTVQSLGG
jgi:hypothetical protein